MDFISEFLTTHFWVAVGQIAVIDILLGGDNAVVIALACRRLPRHQRTKGIVLGTGVAIVLRVILIFFAMALLRVPLLKLGGAVLLLWIGVKLIAPTPEADHKNISASEHLWAAVRTIAIADLVMSLDNVIGIAAVAQQAGEQHEMVLVVFGLLLSVPIIIFGSQLVLRLMDRFPIIILGGGMLLGWIAGGMTPSDPILQPHIPQTAAWHYGAAAAGALLVLLLGLLLRKRYRRQRPTPA